MSYDYFPDFLDSSMMSHFKECPTKFLHEYIQDWKPKEPSVHLHAGAAFAKAIEVARNAFYTGRHAAGINLPDGTRGWSEVECPKSDRDYAIAAGLQALIFAYGDFQCPADSPKSLERMLGAFEFYWENYALNDDDAYPVLLPGGRRGIEFSFSEPLPIDNPVTGQPLLYCGRFDAILNYGGTILITDEKTTTQLGATWSQKWDLRGQFLGYSWASQKSGIHVDGALIRGISILKNKFDTQQAIVMHPDWLIASWYNDLLDEVERLIGYWKRKRWPHNYDEACAAWGGCPFKRCCTSQDPQPWLETYFERRRWNPVEHKETKL